MVWERQVQSIDGLEWFGELFVGRGVPDSMRSDNGATGTAQQNPPVVQRVRNSSRSWLRGWSSLSSSSP